MPEPLLLTLVRHGETAWSRSGQHTGASDIPLTPDGEARARQLAPWLAKRHFDHVFSSPRLRALRTCELAGLGSRVAVEPDLAEWDYGKYEGLTTAEIIAVRPGWGLFRDGAPGGESPAEVSARVDRLIARLFGLGGAIALFAHGHLGSALAARWLQLAMVEGEHFPLSPASVSMLGVDAHHGGARVLELWGWTMD